MKFITAWSDVLSQNQTLKIVIMCLSCLVVLLGFAAVANSFKPPLLIEKGCYNKVKQAVSDKHSETEIEAFIKWALGQRFNSDEVLVKDVLSYKESKKRKVEFKEIKHRKLKQKVIVNAVELKDGKAYVDSDRLISVGKVRSAFVFPLVVSLESVSRSMENPYGLRVKSVDEIKRKKRK